MLAVKQLFSIVALSAFLTVASAQARSGCSRNGTVQANDTCNIFSARNNVSTYQLAFANKAIDPPCNNIFPGENLCLGLVGEDCDTVVSVQSGDSCSSIATAANILMSTLIANNPNVNANCTNIYPGEVLCIDSNLIEYS
jgi:LysM repeat protein